MLVRALIEEPRVSLECLRMHQAHALPDAPGQGPRLVLAQVGKSDQAMGTDQAKRDLPRLQQPDQARPRDVQEVGRLR